MAEWGRKGKQKTNLMMSEWDVLLCQTKAFSRVPKCERTQEEKV